MSKAEMSQYLPPSGIARERLRQKGQFWTPAWVAEAMVAYVAPGSEYIFDPAVGAGAFFRAARAFSERTGHNLSLLGMEIDPRALRQAEEAGLAQQDLVGVEIADFLLTDHHSRKFKAIVGNPPYIRHHRLEASVKAQLRAFSRQLLGTSLDGRAGLHVYFLLQALALLDKGGRLAFIMPADTCEGIFSVQLWNWITRNYCLEAVITFTPDAAPFPGVDTNAMIFMIKNAAPRDTFHWVSCKKADTRQLAGWVLAGLPDVFWDDLSAQKRDIAEALKTGLSRPEQKHQDEGPTLGEFARTMRGIATGANEFFFLTVGQVRALRIPEEFLLTAVGRTRDIPGDLLTAATMQSLSAAGRPTLLFSPDGRDLGCYPQPVRDYLQHGVEIGIHRQVLVATRHPWYKMEVRVPPPILFAYLGRRNARFIRNLAAAVPLTGFICVYPRLNDLDFAEKLWYVLKHPQTLANLPLVGKSYGDGAIKVEPRCLERLPLPSQVVADVGLRLVNRVEQLRLLDVEPIYGDRG